MFIDTTSKEAIYESLMSMLVDFTTKEEIDGLLSGDDNDLIATWISRQVEIDEVLINHLTRRLIGTEQEKTYNLRSLLLGKNSFSNFLQKYGITFENSSNNDVNLYFRGKKFDLSNNEFLDKTQCWRLAARLRYNEHTNYRDTCINGFCTAVNIQYDLSYVRALSYGPEFLQDLGGVFSHFGCSDDFQNMINEYINNSRYYCIAYKVPLKECFMDCLSTSTNNYADELLKNLLEEIILVLKGMPPSLHLYIDDNANIPSSSIYKIIDLTEMAGL